MPRWLGEIIALLAIGGSSAAIIGGLLMIHPGLCLAAAGAVVLGLAVRWLRRDPGLPDETGQRDSRENGPDDDDGQMEVQVLR